MKLSSRYDMDAPIARVFAELMNTDQWERAAMRRGAHVTRTDGSGTPGPGTTWLSRFRFRGKDRTASLRIDRMTPPGKLELAGLSSLLDAQIVIDLLELSVRRTRMQLGVELRPKTLASKLYFQSLRLARGRVERNFQARVGQFALELEDRIRQH